MDESRCFSALPRAPWRPRLSRLQRPPHRQSGRIRPALYWRLDAALPANHSVHHTVAQTLESSRTHSLPPHARLVRFLLCLPAFSYLHRPGPVFLSRRNVEGRRNTPLHHRGVPCFCFADSLGHYFHERLDPPPRRAPLANSPPLHLCCCHLRRDSLLLASQIRCPRTANVRSHPGHPATLAPSHVVGKAKGHASS